MPKSTYEPNRHVRLRNSICLCFETPTVSNMNFSGRIQVLLMILEVSRWSMRINEESIADVVKLWKSMIMFSKRSYSHPH